MKQGFCRGYGQLAPVVSRPFIVRFFVHRSFVQAENPGLNIALWNQSRDSLGISINSPFSVIKQRLIELAQPLLNRASIRVNYHDQLSSGPGLTTAICTYLDGELIPDPILSTPRARGRRPERHLMSIQSVLFQISVDEHLVAGVFQKGRRPEMAYSPSLSSHPRAINSEGCRLPSGSILNSSVRTCPFSSRKKRNP